MQYRAAILPGLYITDNRFKGGDPSLVQYQAVITPRRDGPSERDSLR